MSSMLLPRLASLTFLIASCAPAAPTNPEVPTSPTASATPTVAAVASTPSAGPPAPAPCGGLGCLSFDTPEQALEAVLKEQPLVLAIGEAHAQKDNTTVTSSTKRFTEQLLPLLRERASDLVLELMVADGKCGTEKQVAEVQQPVTQGQAKTNKSEFVLLAEAAKEAGVRPHVLRPSCDDYQAVLQAGPDGVAQMLTMIASLTDDLVRGILAHNAETGAADKLIIAYGGAMHNDLSPRAGREPWSFGPRLSEHTQGRFVELDLFVPEFIKDTESWRSFPWYEHYDRARLGGKVVLFHPSDGSYVMIFAATSSP